jgi:translation initiation factor IF-2, N-terminal domain protein
MEIKNSQEVVDQENLNSETNEKIKENELEMVKEWERIRNLKNEIENERRKNIEKEYELKEKELVIKEREKSLEKELLDKKNEFENNLREDKLNKELEWLKEIDNKISNHRGEQYKKLEDEMDELRKNRIKEIDEQIKLKQEEYDNLQNKILELDEKEKRLNNKEDELEKKEEELQYERRRVKNKENNNQKIIEEEVARKISDEKDSFEIEKEGLANSIENLKIQLQIKENEIRKYDNFVNNYGSTPEIIMKKIKEKELEIDKLREELANRPSLEIQKRLEIQEEELKQKRFQIEEMRNFISDRTAEISESKDLKMENINLKLENKKNESIIDSLRGQLDSLKNELERLSYPEGRESTREQRIQEIEKGELPDIYVINNDNKEEINEIEWLNNIYKNCNEYGIKFNKRILYAFHTSLKISDWSILTVLAGVSGTGKSELPKLYAKFGGLNFINIAVQPNWDSQESMLGYFNSIDNRFDAQPLLRFLAQVTKKDQQKNENEILPSECMSLILLDEMNLAHVEHYFSDFLSKLEERRSLGKKEPPKIEIKLGSGLEPYELKMYRNLLWTGTMNQDETTKSLSDKVLDRGVIINFPRPKKLESRKKMELLNKFVKGKNIVMLTEKEWKNWLKRENTLSEEQMKEIEKYRKIVEDINEALEGAGRALGHRVWQAIEFYILNYPLVLNETTRNNGEMTEKLVKNMRIAFEDQIVQKIMPKLRGIEVRGSDKKVLDKIKNILEENDFNNLIDDFDFAMEHGYGQFIWNSAKYITKEELEENVKNEVI